MLTCPPAIKKQLGNLALASTNHMGDIIILTSVAAWVASSAAQIIGIALNKNYSHEQKKFMISQEAADAITNIGLYFGITSSLKWLSGKMVSTGKLTTKPILNFLENKGLTHYRGKFNFDITKVPGFKEGIKTSYDSFKNFAEASAAITGGIISSNIVTPIVRNEIASYRQNKYKRSLAQTSEIPAPKAMQENNSVQQRPQISTQRHTFADFSRNSLRI